MSSFSYAQLRNSVGAKVPRPVVLRRVGLVALAVTASAIFGQPGIAIFALAWVVTETLFASRIASLYSPSKRRLKKLATLIQTLSSNDALSESLLEQRVKELEVHGELTEYETKWLERLRELVQIRALAFGKRARGRLGLRQVFLRAHLTAPTEVPNLDQTAASLEDILESAIAVSDLFWKLYRTCDGEYPELSPLAKHIFASVLKTEFHPEQSRKFLASHTDRMAREHGLPFLILAYAKTGEIENARIQMQGVVEQGWSFDEDLRTALYWIAELSWFTREDGFPIGDHEATIRYLYHLCFTGPERAGFLEIDSQFFQEFEIVNELAREGFTFREALFEKALAVWESYEGLFDSVMRNFLEQMSGQTHKLFEQRSAWVRYWNREKDQFSREYLYVVEGNLCYLAGQYDDALQCYRDALKINPNLRSARLNRVFAAALAGNRTAQWGYAEEISKSHELFPAGLFAAANSYVLADDESTADHFYGMLRSQPGWERKADFYRSTFCFAQGRIEQAVRAAERAYELNPGDTSIRFHLSQCYSVAGAKDRALDLVRSLGPEPQWLSYYRFTLERDNGLHSDASKTLLEIPATYFEDPDEFEAAMQFAKERRDFVLLRHLKNKRSA